MNPPRLKTQLNAVAGKSDSTALWLFQFCMDLKTNMIFRWVFIRRHSNNMHENNILNISQNANRISFCTNTICFDAPFPCWFITVSSKQIAPWNCIQSKKHNNNHPPFADIMMRQLKHHTETRCVEKINRFLNEIFYWIFENWNDEIIQLKSFIIAPLFRFLKIQKKSISW